jgi:hypothetical protein
LRVTLLEDSPGTSTFSRRRATRRRSVAAQPAVRDRADRVSRRLGDRPLNADAALRRRPFSRRSSASKRAVATRDRPARGGAPALAVPLKSSSAGRALFARRSGRQEREAIRGAIALGPATNARLALADVYMRGKALQNAERVLRETITVLPDSPGSLAAGCRARVAPARR